MKVVLFCGGFGMRLRGYSENVPKPMVKVGYRPILWHVMKYYAYYGHTDFILCLGYKADVIKRYFLDYDEWVTNDFVLSDGGQTVELFDTDIDDWRITFVDTGLKASVGERLQAVQPHLEDEEVFLANYADGVTDLHLPDMMDFFEAKGRVGCFLSVHPNATFHTIQSGPDGTVEQIQGVKDSDMRINGGFFIFRNEVFDYMRPGEELVEEPFDRLIQDQELMSYRYDGFWACMDTFKEKQTLEDMQKSEAAPWEVWKEHHTSPDQPVRMKSQRFSATPNGGIEHGSSEEQPSEHALTDG